MKARNPALGRTHGSLTRTPKARRARFRVWLPLAFLVSAAAPAASQTGQLELAQRESLTAELAGGGSESFRVAAVADHLLEVWVEQQGIDVEVFLWAPDGEPLARMDSPNGPAGFEPLWVLIPETGDYRLEVRALSKEAEPASFTVEFTDLRPATERDRLLASAAHAYRSGLHSGWAITETEYRDVVRHHQEALATFRDLGEKAGVVRALYRLGGVYLGTHEVWRVPELWEEARALWAELEEVTGEAITLQGLGFFYRSIGEAETALARYEAAAEIWRQRDDGRGQARALEDIGGIYESWGDDEGAVGYLERAAELWGESQRSLATPRRDYALARAARLSGDGESALEFYDRAIAGFRAIDRLTGPWVWALQESAALAQEFGRPELAERRLNEAIEHWDSGANLIEEIGARVDLGRFHAAQGKAERAESELTAALDVANLIDDRRGQVRALGALGRLARAAGRLEAAEKLIERALTVSETLRTAVARDELRASYLASQRANYELYIDLLMDKHAAAPQEGWAARAFEVSERARARSLLDTLVEARAEPWSEAAKDLVDEERQLRRQLGSLEFLRLHILGREHTAAEAEEIEEELDSALRAYQAVQGRLRTESPRLASLTGPETLSAETVQRQVLDDHSLLVEYALGDERSWLWAVTSSDLVAIELPPRAEIERHAREVYALLTARNAIAGGETPEARRQRLADARVQYSPAARRLSEMILGPIRELIDRRRLVVVADGALHYLPFAALPHPTGGEPLIVEREVVSIPSASILAVQRRQLAGRKQAENLVAVVADPVFDPADRRVARLDATPRPAPVSRPGQPLLRAQRSLGLNRFSRPAFLTARSRQHSRPGAAHDAPRSDRLLRLEGLRRQWRAFGFSTGSLCDSWDTRQQEPRALRPRPVLGGPER